MTNEQVLNDLKQKRLPTFGTAGERRDRLKKHLGLDSTDQTIAFQPINRDSQPLINN